LSRGIPALRFVYTGCGTARHPMQCKRTFASVSVIRLNPINRLSASYTHASPVTDPGIVGRGPWGVWELSPSGDAEGRAPAERSGRSLVCFKIPLGKRFGDVKCQVHRCQQTDNFFFQFVQADNMSSRPTQGMSTGGGRVPIAPMPRSATDHRTISFRFMQSDCQSPCSRSSRGRPQNIYMYGVPGPDLHTTTTCHLLTAASWRLTL